MKPEDLTKAWVVGLNLPLAALRKLGIYNDRNLNGKLDSKITDQPKKDNNE